MARKCSICIHAEVDSINLLLINGLSLRDIAGRYGVTRTSLQRHFRTHIPAVLLKAKADRELRSAENLNEEVKLLNTKIYKVITAAESRLVDPENKEVYSIDVTKDDITGILVDSNGSRKIELNREKTARLLLQSIREASRLIELQVCLEFTDRLEEIEKALQEKGR